MLIFPTRSLRNLLLTVPMDVADCVLGTVDVAVRTRIKSKLGILHSSIVDILLYDLINIKIYATNKIVVKHKIMFKSVVVCRCFIGRMHTQFMSYSETEYLSHFIHDERIYAMYVLVSKHVIYG